MPNLTLKMRRPDDWHVHLRDGAMLSAVLAATATTFGRAIVMPNLKPPVTTRHAARAYRERILQARPAGSTFIPLMTCYLTGDIDTEDLRAGFDEGLFTAAKFYPAGATTHSEAGVRDLREVYQVLECMQRIGMPLLIHGEVVDPAIDVFDREAVFIDRILAPLRRDLPELKLVLEHITTREGVAFVEQAPGPTAATITPHHLMINRNAMFEQGLRPHAYCLPVAKRETHRVALRRAATSGNPRFFLGTDSAPHLRQLKEHECGCAGIFNAPTALACYAQVFAEENALVRLEGFASLHGPQFYGLAPNAEHITLSQHAGLEPALELATPQGPVRIFAPDSIRGWRVQFCAA